MCSRRIRALVACWRGEESNAQGSKLNAECSTCSRSVHVGVEHRAVRIEHSCTCPAAGLPATELRNDGAWNGCDRASAAARLGLVQAAVEQTVATGRALQGRDR